MTGSARHSHSSSTSEASLADQSLALPLDDRRRAMLITFSGAVASIFYAGATVCQHPLIFHVLGAGLWVACVVLVMLDSEAALKRRMGVLLGAIAVLGVIDINTSLDNANFLRVGVPFFVVILIPALILRKTDPGVIRYRFWPRHWRRADVIYTLLSIPLAWGILRFYWWVNPELYLQWTLPPEPDDAMIKRLFIGINLVGIWDELFFVNTVFAILRSLFRFPIANAVQAVVYTFVLFDMAFIGIGPLIIFAFAWTQGSMFEKSESLLWVLIVHLIVDYFLVAAIVHSYYPSYGLDFLWRHGF